MADWNARYNAASKEYADADVEYAVAEQAMARAVFRRNRAERELNSIYRERVEQLNGDVGGARE